MHAGRVQDGKFFLRANECGAKAHELNQLKNRKTRGCTKVVCKGAARGGAEGAQAPPLGIRIFMVIS